MTVEVKLEQGRQKKDWHHLMHLTSKILRIPYSYFSDGSRDESSVFPFRSLVEEGAC